jgi:hypothetical protein
MNVDLDVLSRRTLEPLAQAFGKRASQLYVGPVDRYYTGHFELAASYKKDADALIVGFVRLIKRLSRSGRAAWTHAYRRDFNVGIQGGMRPRSFELAIKAETLALIRSVNARLVVTVYAAEVPRAHTAEPAGENVPPNKQMQRTRPAQAREPRR